MTNAKHTPEPWWIDDEGFIAAGNGDTYCTVADPHCRPTADAGDENEANARRICAAINACKGISTEALERGVIAEMRHVLGKIVTAASDLDAAIDGVTDQFDAERNRLNAALRVADGAFGGMEINVHELLSGRQQIAAIWSIEDVQQVRPDLNHEQAWQVLRDVDRHHDAENGINWTTLEIIADELFGRAPETDAKEE